MNTKKSSVKVKLVILLSVLLFLSIVLCETFIILSFKGTMNAQMEASSLEIAKNITTSIESGNRVSKAVETQMEDKIHTAAQAVLHMKDVNDESLTDIAKKVGVTEVAFANKEGVVLYSNYKENLGFKYKENSDSRKLLNTDALRVDEPIKISQTDNKYYKYGSATLDHTGFVQVGIEASKAMKLINENSAQGFLDKMDKSRLLYAEVLDKDLKVIAHTDKNKVGKKIDDSLVTSALKEQKAITKKDTDSYFLAIPYKENNSTAGVVGISISAKEINQRAQRAIFISILIAVVSILITIAATYKIISNMLAPLTKLAESAEKISKGDLTEEIILSNNDDEFGRLSRGFHEMVVSLKSIISDIQYSSKDIINSSHELASFSEEVSSTSDEITNTMQNIKSASISQSEEMNLASDSVKDLSEKLTFINEIVDSLKDSSTVTGELSTSGKKYLVYLNNSINDIGNSSKNISDKIQVLNSKSSEISTIIQVINSISEQTNLLALNAAIEAARVGEAGKGFAVVADEIRKLAEQSKGAAMKIEEIIKDILTESNETVKVAKESENIISEGVVTAKSTEDCFNDIIQNIQTMIPQIQKTANLIEDTNNNRNKVNNSVDKALNEAKDINSSLQQIAASTEEQSEGTEQLANIASNLNTLALKLKENVDKFNV